LLKTGAKASAATKNRSSNADLQLAKTLIVMVTTFVVAVFPTIVVCFLGVVWDDVYITNPEMYNPDKANMFNSFALLRFFLVRFYLSLILFRFFKLTVWIVEL